MTNDPAFLEYLLEIGALKPDELAIERQSEMVNQLRQGGQVPGMRRAGNVAQAANPLEFVSALGNQYMAKQGWDQMGAMQNAYGEKRRGALQGLRGKLSATDQAPVAKSPFSWEQPYIPTAGE